jgi:hypothetical protein
LYVKQQTTGWESRFLKFFCIKKMNELVATGNKLTNNFADLVRSCLGPDVGREPLVVSCWYRLIFNKACLLRSHSVRY